MSVVHSDILVLGSGVAGLSCAIKIAKNLPEKKILVVTKAAENETNTKYAQGGIASVWDPQDSFEEHIQDTLVAGDFLNLPEIVRLVVEKAPDCMNQLIEWGTDFDKNPKGEIDLGMEGGHSANRILHHKDVTGAEVERTLLE